MTRRGVWRIGSLLCLLGCTRLEAQADATRAERQAQRQAERAAERQAVRQAQASERAAAGQDEADPVARRALLESRLREALGQVVRRRLNLDDAQTTRLMGVNQRFNDERMRLFRDEVRIRRDLRRAVAAGGGDNSPQTAQLLDQLLDIQRQRVETQQKEQQALAEFLTPEQRARYLSMMDELRRRVQSRLQETAPLPTPPE
jgi:Spy/CpxP family protein refolding chaperone